MQKKDRIDTSIGFKSQRNHCRSVTGRREEIRNDKAAFVQANRSFEVISCGRDRAQTRQLQEKITLFLQPPPRAHTHRRVVIAIIVRSCGSDTLDRWEMPHVIRSRERSTPTSVKVENIKIHRQGHRASQGGKREADSNDVVAYVEVVIWGAFTDDHHLGE